MQDGLPAEPDSGADDDRAVHESRGRGRRAPLHRHRQHQGYHKVLSGRGVP